MKKIKFYSLFASKPYSDTWFRGSVDDSSPSEEISLVKVNEDYIVESLFKILDTNSNLAHWKAGFSSAYLFYGEVELEDYMELYDAEDTDCVNYIFCGDLLHTILHPEGQRLVDIALNRIKEAEEAKETARLKQEEEKKRLAEIKAKEDLAKNKLYEKELYEKLKKKFG